MKANQRFDFAQLAKVLAERGLVEPRALQEALLTSSAGGTPFPEALVAANLVADWELSRLVCELYNLPFLTVEHAAPDRETFTGLDTELLLHTGMLPLFRHGQVLTLCMPGLVPAETLALISDELEVVIRPVVGTVRSNRMWLEENLRGTAGSKDGRRAPSKIAPPSIPSSVEATSAEVDEIEQLAVTGWADIFDAADAAVLLELGSDTPEDYGPEEEPEKPIEQLTETQFVRRAITGLPLIRPSKKPIKASEPEPEAPTIEIDFDESDAE